MIAEVGRCGCCTDLVSERPVCSRSAGGFYNTPRPLAVFKGLYIYGEVRGMGGKGRIGERRVGEGGTEGDKECSLKPRPRKVASSQLAVPHFPVSFRHPELPVVWLSLKCLLLCKFSADVTECRTTLLQSIFISSIRT